jgi:hypothetical protein
MRRPVQTGRLSSAQSRGATTRHKEGEDSSYYRHFYWAFCARSIAALHPHQASAPLVPEEFAEFCAKMIERYAVPAGKKRPEPDKATQSALQC